MEGIEASAGHETEASGRNDLGEGLGWLVFGCAVLVGSLCMDRLRSQGVQPYAAPGLLPGLLGIVIVLFGALLALRGWRRHGLGAAPPAGSRPPSRQLPVVLGLCLIFGLGLVGHGLPFWIAAALFVTAAILVLQHEDRKAAGRFTLRPIANAALIGLGAGLGATLVFQDLFLVRLP